MGAGWVDYYWHQASGPVTYTLTIHEGEAWLAVDTVDCQSTLCISDRPGTDTCTVYSGTHFKILVFLQYTSEAASYTLTFTGSPAPACSDVLDDDADGKVDYPEDPGCDSPDDRTEADMEVCPQLAPQVVLCTSIGNMVVEHPLHLVETVGGPNHRAAGYVDAYVFNVSTLSLTVPCVTLVLDNATVSPCQVAGGTYSERRATLLFSDSSEPRPLAGPKMETVRVCEATLRATVEGFGVNSMTIYALC